MSSQSFQAIREHVRSVFRDVDATLWSDDWLDVLIDEAQRDWCLETGELRGACVVTAGEDVVLALPSDCFQPIGLLDAKLQEIPVWSWRRLHAQYPDFRMVTGSVALAVVFDYDTSGCFRIFPVLPSGTAVGTLSYYRTPPSGELAVHAVDGIEAHVLYRMSLLSDKSEAANYWRTYKEAIGKYVTGNRRLSGGAMRGRFF